MSRRRHRDTGDSRESGDTGFALTEVVVAIALIGTIVMAGVAATWTNARTANAHRDSVVIDALLRSSAESILSPSTDYVDCATPTTYLPELATDPTGRVAIRITGAAYWDGASPPTFSDACGTDFGATELTLTATSARGGSRIELVIVKRSSQ